MSYQPSLNPTLRVLFASALLTLTLTSGFAIAEDNDEAPAWCKSAKTKVEKAICSDEELSSDDTAAGVLYKRLSEISPSNARPALLVAQRKWIADRERCGESTPSEHDLTHCIGNSTRQHIDDLLDGIRKSAAEERLREFRAFRLKTYKDPNGLFEFSYPASWKLSIKEGYADLAVPNSPDEALSVGIGTAAISAQQCTYTEPGISTESVRSDFYEGTVSIGGKDFEKFGRGWIPNGNIVHYYRFDLGKCYDISVSDDYYNHREDSEAVNAEHELADTQKKDLKAYADAVISTFRFTDSSR